MRSHDMMGIVDGSEPCPTTLISDAQGKEVPNSAYALWIKKDQFLLGWINMTLSESVLSTVYGLQTSHQVWTALASRFASQSRSRVSHLKRQLQCLSQGAKSCSEYLQSAKVLADQLVAVGKPTEDEDLISFIISGLNPSFNGFITSFSLATRDNPLTFLDFQDELLSHEMLLKQQTPSPDPTNFALFMPKSNSPQQNRFPSRNGAPHFHKKGKNPHTYNYPSRNGPSKLSAGSAPKPPQQNNGQNFSNTSRPSCQICGKTSHTAIDCFHRMDYSYQGRHPPSQLAAMVAHTNQTLEEQPWYADSGANAHITNDLENLTIQQPFQGHDTVTVGDGAGIHIQNTGQSDQSHTLGRQS
ncbi:hypothetical protein F2P56_033269 [Juglans regia]|uniref:Uncharacterized protein n=1 Tax=Juglans regia TaxID=51240 RepID=A0A833WVL4_JUGRE|nr:hypothetical protein F2P56_033269 [Juglans regia]